MKTPISRREDSRSYRNEQAQGAYLRSHPDANGNGDETTFSNYLGNYHKGLPHNSLGEVDKVAYETMVRACVSGEEIYYELIPLGTVPAGSKNRKLVSPQAGWAFDLEGPDAWELAMAPPPSVASAETAGEMVELYWMALLRDLHFSDYATHADAAKAVADLNKLSDFKGPKSGGLVTTGTLFRGFTPGDLAGPYVSQFLLKDFDYGTLRISQANKVAVAGKDYLTDWPTFLNVQNGQDTSGTDVFDTKRRYIRNGRDLSTYVHFDALYEAYLNACLYLLEIKAPFDMGNPYNNSPKQAGFATFGGPHILSLVTEVATRALKAVWHQKWNVNRRLRPEAYGGLLWNQLCQATPRPIHKDVLNSAGLAAVRAKFASSPLLPMAFPEGSPLHPAYGAGHATVAAACVTILKAWFDESFILPDPKVASADGLTLVNYTGADAGKLTVGGELDKVAANVALGRSHAGVHWRSDYTESMKLGEEIAIRILQEQKAGFNESCYFNLSRFDGTRILI